MSTNINSTEQIVEINAGDQITNVNIVSQSTTQVISGEQVVTIDTNAGTIPAAWGSITGTLSNQTDLQNALNLKQNNITLTTTGTTGVATLVGATLNIPNYVTSTKQTEWDSAYNDKINSAEVSGTTTKTLTLTQQDGGIIQASWSDFDTAPVTSVFGRTGDVVATEGDYNINQLGDVTITSATNGQVLKYNGTAWVNAADASGLTSVGLAMPSAFTVSGSPLTSNGTITVTGAGTTSQYVRGDGSLANFPSTSNEAKTLIREVYNSTGATLTKGTVVYINGGQGNLPTVTKALAVGDVTSAQTFGIVQSDITNNNNGFVVVAGGIDNIDTQAYTEGTAIYLSPTTAGAWTSTKPYAPDHIVYLGVIVRSHPTQGVIEVKIQNGYELDELHNVSARFPVNKDGLFYNSTLGVWENKSIAGVLGYTPVPESRIITINGTAQNLSADRTYNVGTVTSIAASGGTGISISGSPVTGSGTISITNTAPDQIVSLTGAGTTSISGTYPNFTVTSNDQYVGTVTSVNATVPTGFEVSGVPITSSGTIDISFSSGYSLPTNAKQTQWDDAYAKRINSLTVTGNSGSATLTSNVLNVPTYTLTGLGGEPAITAGTTLQYFRGDKTFQTLDTSVVPENGNVYFTEPRVRATVLSGLNITGGSISASDSILNAFGKVQNQINGLIGGSIFQSTWNASTNTPSLASGVGTKGYYYIVSVAGTTNLDGITDWQIGDWAIFDGTVWRKVDNTDAVVSVNGYTGVVNLVLDDLADVSAASPTSNQLLRFNGTSSKWENWTPNYLTTITLTGDVTGTGTSSIVTTIGADKVTNAMLAGSIDYAKMNAATVPTWNQDTTGNAATADKWKTARTLTVGATGKSVDGSANVTWSLSEIGALSNSTTSVQDGYFGDIYLYDDSTPSHYLQITNSANLTAARTLSINVNDVNRTISLSGNLTVSAAATISGTNTGDQDLSGYLTTATAASTYLPLAGGTMTGALQFTDFGNVIIIPHGSNNSSNILFKQDGTNYYDIDFSVQNGLIGFYDTNTSTFIWRFGVNGTDKNKLIHNGFGGTLIDAAGKYLGNTASTDKLVTARNFTINGTAKSFDGSANVSWTAAEIGLTSYLPLTGGTLTGALSGTSATFSSSVTAAGSAYFGTFNGSNKYYFEPFSNLAGGANNAYLVSGKADNNERSGFVFQARNSNGEEYNVVAFEGYNSTATSTAFAIGSTGAATFSSSVTAGGVIATSGTGLNSSVRIANTTATTGVDWHLYSLNNGNFGLYNNTASSYAFVATSGGNVGIGTTSPGYKLHVTNAANGFISRFTGGASSDVNIGVYATSSPAGGSIGTESNHPFSIFTNSTDRLTITSGGNVGIGTTSPSYALDVSAGTAGSSGRIRLLHATSSASLQMYVGVSDGTGFIVNNNPLWFEVNGTERMRITSGGDIRIGPSTTSNQWYFNYNGTNNKGGISINYTTGEYQIWTGESGNGYYQTFFTNGSERMRITSGGRVDFTEYTRAQFYQIYKDGAFRGGLYNYINASGSGSDYSTTLTSETAIYFCPNGSATKAMTITTGGEVLINTTTDSGAYYLQVNGSVYATAYYESSDIRLKDVLTNSYSENFSAIEFMWKDKRDDKKHWGYAAQDVMKYIPDAIEVNNDGMMTVNYNEAHTWKIAQLEAKIVELEAKLK